MQFWTGEFTADWVFLGHFLGSPHSGRYLKQDTPVCEMGVFVVISPFADPDGGSGGVLELLYYNADLDLTER